MKPEGKDAARWSVFSPPRDRLAPPAMPVPGPPALDR